MTKQAFLLVIFLHFANVTCAQIDFSVKEEQHAPVLLGNIASKARITTIPDLDFSLLNRKDLFEVDESTGDFRTKTNLDREILCGSVPKCVIVTSVAVSSAPDFFQRYSINVIILDINDQRPSFGMASFPRSISERADINATIKLPVAFDADCEPAFKVQTYRLEPENQKTFGLVVDRQNKSDGTADFDVHLRLLEKIDREVVGSYMLTLVASDGGSPSNEGKLQVMISVTDENDNKPEFKEKFYEKSVKEVAPVGTTVLTVSVRDADDGENGRVGFEFPGDVDRKVLDYFEVNSASGEVTLVKSLENEGGTSFVFKIKGFDHGTPMMFSEVNVKITVEDTVNNPPSIRISQWRSKNDNAIVSEDVVVGTKIALIDVVDTDSGDNGEIRCRGTSEYFSLEEYNSPGEYTVSVGRDLDREKMKAHVIVIQCVDKGTPPLYSTANLTVVVEDVNDNRPEFTRKSYEMTVTENQDVGLSVGNVFAKDVDEGANALIRYSVESSIVEFEIDEVNGNVFTSIKGLDREVKGQYVFQVYAFDVGLFPLTATATVTVNISDENDENPKFENSSYNFVVSETSDVTSIIGQVSATDLDLGLGGLVEYLLVHSPLHPDPPYSLSQEDGTLTLTKPLDYELTKEYNFVITALDLGKPPRNSSVEVKIEVHDENDNDPVIVFPNKYNLSVTLDLNVVPGQEVITVLAHDSDMGENGRLTYSLRTSSSQIANIFRMNKDTGLVTLLAPLNDVEPQRYNISLIVQDNGNPPRTTHAVLQLEITKEADKKRPNESYTIIVIVMVCVTLLIAVIVFVTFCFIKYIDNRKYSSNRNSNSSNFKPITSTPEDFPQNEEAENNFDQNISTFSSMSKHSLPPPNRGMVNTKKSVTFDNAVTSSEYPNSTEPVKSQTSSIFNSDRSLHSLKGDTTLHNFKGDTTLHNFRGDTTLHSVTNSPHGLLYDYYIPRTFHAPNSSSLCGLPDSDSNKTYLHSFSPIVTPATTLTLPPCNIKDSPRTHNHSRTVTPSPNGSVRTDNQVNIVNNPANESPRTNIHTRITDLPANRSPKTISYANELDSPANWSPRNKSRVRKVDPATNGSSSYKELFGETKTDDEMIGVALEKHKALVRSMVSNERRPPGKRKISPGSAVHDLDLCSSSSVETSDSGHGGSELDISVAKMGT